ncbi:hypothetical protein [Bacteroides sp.]|uniref:hypothetical protein n=1 Tax=Bacteroides sp. TaxID=29523 RepID=UPI00260F4D12|nr:hypothetical protein [Bacteroides sp.]
MKILAIFLGIFIWGAIREIIVQNEGYFYTVLIASYALSFILLLILYNKKQYPSYEYIAIVSFILSLTGAGIYSTVDILFLITTFYPKFSNMLIIITIILIMLSTVIWQLLHMAKYFRLVIYLRYFLIISYLLITLTLLGFYLSYFFSNNIFTHLSATVTYHDLTILMSTIFIGTTIYYILFCGKELITNTYLTKYSNSKSFILILRCFKYEANAEYKNIVYRIHCAFETSYALLQIGNPMNILKGYENCDTFYLPTTNWRPIVRRYIENASIIFIIIDYSNGVIWEILNHSDLKRKFIYYIPKDVDINKVISATLFKTAINQNNSIANLFFKSREFIVSDRYLFFNEGIMYIHNDIYSLIKLYLTINDELKNNKNIINICSYYEGRKPCYISKWELLSPF